MNCPKCTTQKHVKNGIVNGKQRYRCNGCGYNYTVEQKSGSRSKETKRMALEMYLEGLGFHAISRLLHVSHVSVQRWIRTYGKEAMHLKSNATIPCIEMDELHTYIGDKKTTVGSGLLLIAIGINSSNSCLALAAQKQGGNYGNAFKAKTRHKS